MRASPVHAFLSLALLASGCSSSLGPADECAERVDGTWAGQAGEAELVVSASVDRGSCLASPEAAEVSGSWSWGSQGRGSVTGLLTRSPGADSLRLQLAPAQLECPIGSGLQLVSRIEGADRIAGVLDGGFRQRLPAYGCTLRTETIVFFDSVAVSLTRR